MARIAKNDLIRLQKRFLTDARIGQEFGITRQAVHQLRKKYGIDSRTAGNPLRNKDISILRQAGKSVETIARKFKLSVPQTYRILKDGDRKKAAAKKPAAKKVAAKKPAAKNVAVKKPAAKKAVAEKVAAKKKK